MWGTISYFRSWRSYSPLTCLVQMLFICFSALAFYCCQNSIHISMIWSSLVLLLDLFTHPMCACCVSWLWMPRGLSLACSFVIPQYWNKLDSVIHSSQLKRFKKNVSRNIYFVLSWVRHQLRTNEHKHYLYLDEICFWDAKWTQWTILKLHMNTQTHTQQTEIHTYTQPTFLFRSVHRKAHTLLG